MSEPQETNTDLVVNDRRHRAADAALLPATSTPMSMIAQAIERGLPVETLNKLMDLKERFDKAEARKAFDAAFALARVEFPDIRKKKHVGYFKKDKQPGEKDVSYYHETLENLTAALNPPLGRHGLSFSWDIDQKSGDGSTTISVTCTLCHYDGHSRSVTMTAPPDESGKKNRIQQIASTVSYLQRYTLKAVAGVAAGDDDDAQKAEASQEIEFDTDAWADKIDAAFAAKDRAQITAVKDAMIAEAKSGKMPQWAENMLSAHFSSSLAAAKRDKQDATKGAAS